MSILCGNCQGRHSSVAEVRSCSMGGSVMVMERPSLASREEAERVSASEAQAERWLREGLNETNEGLSEEEALARANNCSVPQAKFMLDLLRTRDTGQYGQSLRHSLAIGTVDRRAASRAISRLKDFPKARTLATTPEPKADRPEEPKVTEDGIYVHPVTGEFFKVQFNRAKGSGDRLYAKRLLVVAEKTETAAARLEWVYGRNLINQIRPEWKGTAQDAARFGALYGRCMICRRVLTREESIERAMGPICAGKVA